LPSNRSASSSISCDLFTASPKDANGRVSTTRFPLHAREKPVSAQ
jgi:hypothetical protein